MLRRTWWALCPPFIVSIIVVLLVFLDDSRTVTYVTADAGVVGLGFGAQALLHARLQSNAADYNAKEFEFTYRAASMFYLAALIVGMVAMMRIGVMVAPLTALCIFFHENCIEAFSDLRRSEPRANWHPEAHVPLYILAIFLALVALVYHQATLGWHLGFLIIIVCLIGAQRVVQNTSKLRYMVRYMRGYYHEEAAICVILAILSLVAWSATLQVLYAALAACFIARASWCFLGSRA